MNKFTLARSIESSLKTAEIQSGINFHSLGGL